MQEVLDDLVQRNGAGYLAELVIVLARAQRKDLARLEDLDCVSFDQCACPSQLDEPQRTPTRPTD